MLLEGVVHESDAVLFEGVVVRDLIRLILEPLDLIPPDTVHTTCTHAVVTSRTEEP